jgi:uncharacterized protein (DUF952 family)
MRRIRGRFFVNEIGQKDTLVALTSYSMHYDPSSFGWKDKDRKRDEDLVAWRADDEAAAAALSQGEGGALFPHLYGTLPLAAVRGVERLPLGADGRHVLPALDG